MASLPLTKLGCFGILTNIFCCDQMKLLQLDQQDQIERQLLLNVYVSFKTMLCRKRIQQLSWCSRKSLSSFCCFARTRKRFESTHQSFEAGKLEFDWLFKHLKQLIYRISYFRRCLQPSDVIEVGARRGNVASKNVRSSSIENQVINDLLHLKLSQMGENF